MHILVTFAVEAEFAPWRRLRNLREIKISEIAAYQAQIGRAQVDFVITGMGMENAGRATEALLDEPYQFWITAGFAGALGEKHRVGDIVVAESVQELGKPKALQCSRNLVYAARDDGENQAFHVHNARVTRRRLQWPVNKRSVIPSETEGLRGVITEFPS